MRLAWGVSEITTVEKLVCINIVNHEAKIICDV
jgi:hypothetical protein